MVVRAVAFMVLGSVQGSGIDASFVEGAGCGRRPRSSPSVLMERTRRRGQQIGSVGTGISGVSLVITDELESALIRAEIRVLKIQTKLHRWGRSCALLP